MKKTWPAPPEVEKLLKDMGSDLKDARLRRRLKAEIVAERAGVSIVTLRKIERGNLQTAVGNYAKVAFALGLLKNLHGVFDDHNDIVGNMLEEERLPKRIKTRK